MNIIIADVCHLEYNFYGQIFNNFRQGVRDFIK